MLPPACVLCYIIEVGPLSYILGCYIPKRSGYLTKQSSSQNVETSDMCPSQIVANTV